MVRSAGRADRAGCLGMLHTDMGDGSRVSCVPLGMVCFVKYVLPVIISINKTVLLVNSV